MTLFLRSQIVIGSTARECVVIPVDDLPTASADHSYRRPDVHAGLSSFDYYIDTDGAGTDAANYQHVLEAIAAAEYVHANPLAEHDARRALSAAVDAVYGELSLGSAVSDALVEQLAKQGYQIIKKDSE